MIGKTVSHYKILKELGSGGMGVVYKAEDTRLERPVALKFLPPELTRQPEAKERFINEAQAVSALEHPNIRSIHEIDETKEGELFICMGYYEGETLRKKIARGSLQTLEVLDLAIQAAQGLSAAHENGVIHRDIKPTNIIVTNEGIVKILDFGLAKRAGQIQLTQEGTSLGTITFMSPEQARGGVVDHRTDIWSLGVVLYEMISGQLPFQGDYDQAIIYSILNEEPQAITSLRPNLPTEIEQIIKSCLQKEPADRYQHVDDLLIDLKSLQSDLQDQSQPRATSFKKVRKKPSLSIVPIIAALIIIVLIIIFWFTRGGQKPPWYLSTDRRLSLLVSTEERAFDPDLSPDGKMISYVAQKNGQFDLFLGLVAGGPRIQLTDDRAREASPDFSPQGDQIIFARQDEERQMQEICIIPSFGGEAMTIINNGAYPTWSPDGVRLAFVFRRIGEGEILAIANRDGSGIQECFSSNAEYPFLYNPSWSPDGLTLAVRRSRGGVSGEIWVVSSDGQNPKRLSNDPPNVFCNDPVFSTDGKGIIHASNRGGATNLWILPVNGNPPLQLTSGPGPDESPSNAKDGSVAFLNSRWRWNLLTKNLNSGEQRELLSYGYYLWAPSFSPDGAEIVFSRAEVDGSWHIWTIPSKGGATRQLTSGAKREIYPRYTPDGNSIIFQNWDITNQICYFPSQGGATVVLSPQFKDDSYSDISPDGKWIVFSRKEGELNKVYKAPFSGGTAQLLVESASTLPRWSPDGQWIAYCPDRSYKGGIFIIDSNGTNKIRLTKEGGWPVWWPDSKHIGFQTTGSLGTQQIKIVSLETGRIESISGLKFSGTNNPFDISADASLLVTTDGEHLSDEIWLIEKGE